MAITFRPPARPSPIFVQDAPSGIPGDNYSLSFASGSYATTSDGYQGPANDFTVDFFFKSSMTTGVGQLVTTLNHSTGGWSIHLDNGQVVFNTRDPAQSTGANIRTSLSTPDAYADNQWHHVVATMSITNYLMLYVDGTLQAQGQGQGMPSTRTGITLGADYLFPYTGYLDEVGIYAGTGVVPEPSSLLLTSLGLLGLAFRRRRRA